jgi:hypothetical protein
MSKVYDLIPYISVGDIKFGITKIDLVDIFSKEPDLISVSFSKRTTLEWGIIKVRLNKKGLVDEVSFIDDCSVLYDGMDIFNDPKTIKELTKREKPYSTVGFKVFFEFGIAITGFSKKKDYKSLSVFSKELINAWKS